MITTSLRWRMGLLFLAFFLLVSTAVLATFWAIDTQKQDALVINLAGRQRMLIQQMVKDALYIKKGEGDEDAHRADLQWATRTFGQTLAALLDGGQAPYLSGLVVEVPPTRDRDILAKLGQVDDTWTVFHQHLGVMAAVEPDSPDFDAAARVIERLSPDLTRQADEVVRSYETASAQKIARLRWIQAGFLASALALLAAGFLVIHKSVLRPLSGLASIAARIGQGDLSTPVQVNGPHEIKLLTHSLDRMRSEMKASQQELMGWSGELETRVAQRTRELAALHEVSREISSHLDIGDVLSSVTDKAWELLGGEVAFLCLLEDDCRTLGLQASSGPQAAVRAARVSAQHPPADRVLAGEVALPCGVDDCAGSCGILAASYRISHLAAPLWVGERAIGALCVGSSQAGLFSGEAAGLLTKLAGSASIALENAHLFGQAERAAILEERQRIAAEMHDGLAQTLNYLKLKVERASGWITAGRSQDGLGELQHMGAAIAQASREVRQAIASLQEDSQARPALQNELSRIVGEFSAAGQPPIELAVKLQAPLVLPPGQAAQVLSVVREALLNACRHAQASHITVCLKQQAGEAEVGVEDDGRGFDPGAPPVDGGSHFGLSIMRARAAHIGGRFTIYSAVGHGTRVTLAWPAEDEGRNDAGVSRFFVPRLPGGGGL